ncbi:S24 family peptidase [Brucella pseudogrignonensis]|nr:S24 family peptidase [Brucella pseudogrignonensis]
MDELAKAIGYARASSIQRYESENDFNKEFIGMDLVSKLAPALVGKGKPPIEPDEVWALGNPEARSRLLNGEKRTLVDSFDPDEPDSHNDETLTFGSETGFRGAPEGTSPQIDITGGMGAGGLSIVSEGVPGHKGMTFAAEAVSDYWRLPPAVYTSLGLHPQDTVFIPVQGDSMYPTLEEGDVVVVDTRHRWPSPDGIYAILDEIGGLVVKRLEVAQENGENVIRIISDNTRHRIKEKRPDDVFIVGRVLRRFGVIK